MGRMGWDGHGCAGGASFGSPCQTRHGRYPACTGFDNLAALPSRYRFTDLAVQASSGHVLKCPVAGVGVSQVACAALLWEDLLTPERAGMPSYDDSLPLWLQPSRMRPCSTSGSGHVFECPVADVGILQVASAALLWEDVLMQDRAGMPFSANSVPFVQISRIRPYSMSGSGHVLSALLQASALHNWHTLSCGRTYSRQTGLPCASTLSSLRLLLQLSQ